MNRPPHALRGLLAVGFRWFFFFPFRRSSLPSVVSPTYLFLCRRISGEAGSAERIGKEWENNQGKINR